MASTPPASLDPRKAAELARDERRARAHHRLRRRRLAVGVRLPLADARRAATRSTKPRCARSRTQTGGTLLPRARYRASSPASMPRSTGSNRSGVRARRVRPRIERYCVAAAAPPAPAHCSRSRGRAEARMNARAGCMDFAALHFLRPHWLWALLALPLLAWWWRAAPAQRSAWRDAGRSASAAAPAGSQRRPAQSRRLLVWPLLAYALAVLALAGPSWRQVRAAAVAEPHAAGDRAGPVERRAGRRPAAFAAGAGARQARHAAARAQRRAGRSGGLSPATPSPWRR